MLPLKVAGLGVYFPEQRETKEDFLRRGIPEGVIEKLGVYERRLVAKGQTSADLELEAAKMALEDAGILPSEIDLIIGVTVLPERIGMSNANLLQYRLGATRAAAFDLVQACGAVIPAMLISANFFALRTYNRILLTASTHWSVISDPTHPSADFPLGDGAAAAVFTRSGPDYGVLSCEMKTNGEFFSNCGIIVGDDPALKYYENHHKQLLFSIDACGLNGSTTAFKEYLANNGPAVFHAALATAGLKPHDIDCAVIHGNVRPVVENWVQGMRVPANRFPLTFHRYGNMSAATLLVNMKEGLDKGMLRKGNIVALVSQGAGFSAGAIIMRWE